jgi:phytoene dehydrogenase-like protein
MTTHSWDAIVIGAGHNGLVCAQRLAAAGQRVLVLEAAESVGGFAAPRKFAPGFKTTVAAQWVHQFSDGLVRELELERHGLTWAKRNVATTVVSPERCVTDAAGAVTGVSAADASAWSSLSTRLARFGKFMSALHHTAPPRLGTTRFEDTWSLLKLGLRLRLLGRREMREFLRIAGMNVYDLATDEITDPLLQALLAMDATLGSNFGPRAPGTVLTLLSRRANESTTQGGYSLPVGGPAALAAALAKAAEAAGVTVRTGTPVAGIAVENDRVAGVDLANGERLIAPRVISSVDPRQTFLSLLGTPHLDTGFVRRVDHFRQRGITAKVHLALDGLPTFTHPNPEQLGHRLLVASSLDQIELAFNASKYGEVSSRPVLEISIPTIHDPSLAPTGRHVLTAVVNYCAYDTQSDLSAARADLLRNTLAVLETVAPGIGGQVLASELLLPKDLEHLCRINGGHWHHGDLAFDQFLMVRPFPGAAQYDSPIEGLHLCGAGSHPGGGLTGLPGRLAAERILRSRA